ncbi:MAG: hypothetical protein JO131_06795, partial [Gammaproteobacteria bacterium]|nr:hypothetical protein [Gammaproteobacteria bacterium]
GNLMRICIGSEEDISSLKMKFEPLMKYIILINEAYSAPYIPYTQFEIIVDKIKDYFTSGGKIDEFNSHYSTLDYWMKQCNISGPSDKPNLSIDTSTSERPSLSIDVNTSDTDTIQIENSERDNFLLSPTAAPKGQDQDNFLLSPTAAPKGQDQDNFLLSPTAAPKGQDQDNFLLSPTTSEKQNIFFSSIPSNLPREEEKQINTLSIETNEPDDKNISNIEIELEDFSKLNKEKFNFSKNISHTGIRLFKAKTDKAEPEINLENNIDKKPIPRGK